MSRRLNPALALYVIDKINRKTQRGNVIKTLTSSERKVEKVYFGLTGICFNIEFQKTNVNKILLIN